MKKDTVLGSLGGVSGVSSIISSAQACHNICVSGFSTLSIAGAAAAGLPFVVLQQVAVPFWIVGALLYAVLVWLFVFKGGVKQGYLFFNGGILLAGMPFEALRDSSKFFLIVGGTLAVIGLGMLLWGKFGHRLRREINLTSRNL